MHVNRLNETVSSGSVLPKIDTHFHKFSRLTNRDVSRKSAAPRKVR